MHLVLGTLAEQKVPYITFDVKLPPASLDPKKVPAVILPAYRQADGLVTEKFERMLKAYREAGGRVLFLGGHLAPAIEPLSKQMMRSPEGDYWYPLKTSEMPGKKLLLLDSASKPAGEAIPIVQVMRDFDVRLVGDYILKPDAPADVKPVVLLENGKKRLAVGIAQVQDGEYRMIYAPWHFFMPGTLSHDKQVHGLDHPALDASGRAILNHLLGLLKKRDK
jgi:hypothetical protein